MRAVDQLPQVSDQRSFIAFVRMLQAERADPQTRAEWENETIEAYLEAAAAWAEDAPCNYRLRLMPQPFGRHLPAFCIVARSTNRSGKDAL